jgi:hypothetical protein
LLSKTLNRQRNVDDITPLANALVGLKVDGFEFPELRFVRRRKEFDLR